MMNAHGIQCQLSRCRLKESGVQRGARMCYNITTHWTEARVSWPFIVNLGGSGIVCALGQFGRYTAQHQNGSRIE
jgi:hypothetical protein